MCTQIWLTRSRLRLASLAIVLMLLAGQRAGAQDSGASAGPDKSAGDASQTPAGDKGDTSAGTSGTADTGAAKIPVLGGAAPLPAAIGPLRIGDLSLRSVSFMQLYDSLNYTSLNSPLIVSQNTSLFEGNIVFDHELKSGAIVVQYNPRYAIVNGQGYGDFANQDFSVNMAFQLSPQVTLSLHNRFTYFNTLNLSTSYFIDADALSGSTIQSNFLDTPGSLLDESAGASLEYRYSARTTYTFVPEFRYLRSTGFQPQTLSSHTYSGLFNINHLLSATQSVGGYFRYEYVSFPQISGTTQILSAGGTYGQQLGQFWFFSVSGGITHNPALGLSTPWSFSGSGSVTRRFRRSSAAVAYTRSLTSNYITNLYSDRVDGIFSWQISRRWYWRSSAGYQRQLQGLVPISAWYTVQGFNWQVFRKISLFGNYSYRLQNGDGVQVLNGNRSFAGVGIRWDMTPITEQGF